MAPFIDVCKISEKLKKVAQTIVSRLIRDKTPPTEFIFPPFSRVLIRPRLKAGRTVGRLKLAIRINYSHVGWLTSSAVQFVSTLATGLMIIKQKKGESDDSLAGQTLSISRTLGSTMFRWMKNRLQRFILSSSLLSFVLFPSFFSVRYIFAPRFTRSRVPRLEFCGN